MPRPKGKLCVCLQIPSKPGGSGSTTECLPSPRPRTPAVGQGLPHPHLEPCGFISLVMDNETQEWALVSTQTWLLAPSVGSRAAGGELRTHFRHCLLGGWGSSGRKEAERAPPGGSGPATSCQGLPSPPLVESWDHSTSLTQNFCRSFTLEPSPPPDLFSDPYPLHKYLLSTHQMPGTVLSMVVTAVKETPSSVPVELIAASL